MNSDKKHSISVDYRIEFIKKIIQEQQLTSMIDGNINHNHPNPENCTDIRCILKKNY